MSYTLYERDANTAAPSSITRGLQSGSSSPTLTSSPITSGTSSSSSYSASSSSNYDYNSSAFTTSWITYLAIIVVAGVLVALISSRYFYIRRYYSKPSFRAYFLPKNGIHVKSLRLHIKGAPNRTLQTEMTTLNEVYGASLNQRGERRRRRRNRRTVGDTLAPGGARIGDGDEDDGWDYDDIDLERGGGARGELPQYQADSGLPAYIAPPPIPSNDATTTSSTRIGGGGETDDEVDVLPTAAEYEALSRGNRDGEPPSILPTYPPAVHVHGAPPPPHSLLYPTEPPPSFSRANSGISTRSRRTTVLGNNDDNYSRSTFETNRGGEGGREGDGELEREQAERRRQSTATATTASSSASKLDDDDDSVKSLRRDIVASGSKVTLGSSSSADSSNNEKKEEK